MKIRLVYVCYAPGLPYCVSRRRRHVIGWADPDVAGIGFLPAFGWITLLLFVD